MVLHLSRALREKGHLVEIGVFINAWNRHDEIAQRARKLDFPTVELHCRKKLDTSALRKLCETVEQSETEVIHSHGYKSNLYALVANCARRRVLVSTCHNWTGQTASLRAYGTLDRLALRFFNRAICVSENVRLQLLHSGVSPQKLDVILNGIPSSDFAEGQYVMPGRENMSECVVGMVGRLVEAKGFQLVLQCAPAILKQFPNTRFVLVGEGPKRNDWIELTRRLGIESQISFIGKQDDMPRVYRAFDIFVLPSLNEGMPMTVLEAMAAGIPVIATRVGSIPNVLHHGETGLLVEPGDLAGLQQTLQGLLGDVNPVIRPK